MTEEERERFEPGTHGCHEALDRTSVVMNLFDRELGQHPSILMNADWSARVERIQKELWDLYQAIGKEHLNP